MMSPRDIVPSSGGGPGDDALVMHAGLSLSQSGIAAVDAAPFPILILDRELNIVAVNRALAARRHESQASYRGRHLTDLVTPTQWEFLEPLYRHALAGNEVHDPDVVLSAGQSSQAERRSLTLIPIREDGHVVGLAGAFTDEPMRRHVEQELRILTDLHAMLSRASRVAVTSRSSGELYEHLCRVAVEHGRFRCAWVGVPEGDELRPVAQAGASPDAFDALRVSLVAGDPRAECPTGIAARTGHVHADEEYLDERSPPAWRERAQALGVRASAAIPFRCQGEIVATLSVYAEELGFFDEARVRTLGELAPTVSLALERFAATAAGEAQERERARLEEQLRQSAKMEAIGTLAGGVAHDFNNTLTVIRNTCRLLLADDLDAGHRRRITQIDEAAESAASLTTQLLTFGRRQVVRPEVVVIDDVVETAAAMIRRILRESIAFVTEFQAPGAQIRIDRGDLQQVLLNLAANARDAMQGGGQLTLRTGVADISDARATEQLELAPGRYAYIEASDTGIGMDPDTLRRIFEPFFTTKEFGSGLGLATVFGVVRSAGGDVWACSEPDRGTTMRLYFPLCADAGARAAATRAQRRTPSAAGHETVLVVEDSEMLRPIVAEMLGKAGYRVLTATDGLDAVEIAAAHDGAIDLVLTDVVMPRMNGRELAERLAEARPGVRVIYTSGYPADTVVRHGIAESSVTFVQKPYIADDLLAQVRTVLDEAAA